MGTVFPYVADEALKAEEDGICNVCGKDDVDVYRYSGYWIDHYT